MKKIMLSIVNFIGCLIGTAIYITIIGMFTWFLFLEPIVGFIHTGIFIEVIGFGYIAYIIFGLILRLRESFEIKNGITENHTPELSYINKMIYGIIKAIFNICAFVSLITLVGAIQSKFDMWVNKSFHDKEKKNAYNSGVNDGIKECVRFYNEHGHL